MVADTGSVANNCIDAFARRRAEPHSQKQPAPRQTNAREKLGFNLTPTHHASPVETVLQKAVRDPRVNEKLSAALSSRDDDRIECDHARHGRE